MILGMDGEETDISDKILEGKGRLRLAVLSCTGHVRVYSPCVG